MKVIGMALMAALAAGSARAQMVHPAIDSEPGPFSYFSQPTDEIGVMGAEAATEITPEGSLYTGFGELVFFTGPERWPVSQRVRTLEDGHLPIVHYSFTRDGIEYRFTLFAATLDGRPDGTLVNFIRVAMKNTAGTATRAMLTTGLRFQGPSNTGMNTGDNRFLRPAKPDRLGEYRQIGVEFNPGWVYGFSGNAFTRDGKAMYLFPRSATGKTLTLVQRYNDPPKLDARKLSVQPTTPVGIVEFDHLLQPGEEKAVDLKMPVIPVDPASATAASIESASFDTYLLKTKADWQQILARGMQVSLPERKVTDTFQASLLYDLIAIDQRQGNWIQTVNKLHYHSFYLRDSSDIVRMYDVTGYPDIAAHVLAFFPQSQQPDGNFLSQPEEFDGWGETLWAYGQHYQMTHDAAFAKSVVPSLRRALAWEQAARRQDPLHLLPASDVRDNEDVPGHITGYSFLALAGLKDAAAMLNAIGEEADAEAFAREYASYRAAFLRVLDQRAAENHGYIPPALDGQVGGQDWGNLLSTYPEHTLAPNDPRVTATLKATQARYAEGIMTYGDGRWLHHYLTIKNTLTEVIRGDQQQAVQELYALLLHTSATHAGFEFAIRPWGSRDFEGNLSPHGWFAAEYRTLLRSMLVREDEGSLHLLSVVSPEWIGAGKRIATTGAPTEYGRISYTLEQPEEESAVLSINSSFDHAPRSIIVHLPWFMQVSAVEADGRHVSPTGNALTLPAGTHQVRLHWTRRPDAPALNYESTVNSYKTEYTMRYKMLLHSPQ